MKQLEIEERIQKLMILLRREARKAKGFGEKSSATHNLKTLENAIRQGNNGFIELIAKTYGF